MDKEVISGTMEWKARWKKEHLEMIDALTSLAICTRNDEKLN